MKSARDLGIKLPLYGGSGQARLEFAEGAGDASDGFIFGTGKSLIPANWGEGSEGYKVVSDFAERYKAAYGEDPDIFAGHAYDALAIAVDGLKRAGADADAAALPRCDRADQGTGGVRWQLHVLADRSQRPDRRGPRAVPVQGRRMGLGRVAMRPHGAAAGWV